MNQKLYFAGREVIYLGPTPTKQGDLGPRYKKPVGRYPGYARVLDVDDREIIDVRTDLVQIVSEPEPLPKGRTIVFSEMLYDKHHDTQRYIAENVGRMVIADVLNTSDGAATFTAMTSTHRAEHGNNL